MVSVSRLWRVSGARIPSEGRTVQAACCCKRSLTSALMLAVVIRRDKPLTRGLRETVRALKALARTAPRPHDDTA